MTPERALKIARGGWTVVTVLALVGYTTAFAVEIRDGGLEALKSWGPWLLLFMGIVTLAGIRFALRRFESEIKPVTKNKSPTSVHVPCRVPGNVAEDHEVATVAVIVHGVGDHSSGDILANALIGLGSATQSEVESETVEINGLPQLDTEAKVLRSLKVSAAGKTHLLMPTIWSGLRPRPAAILSRRGNTAELLVQTIFQLLPGVWDGLRCVPKAKGSERRLLVAITALVYALLAPALAIGAFSFVMYLVVARAQADLLQYEWWRIPALLIGLQLLRLVVRQSLIICDFVGDVASYVGNPTHRQRAESRLACLLLELNVKYPAAQIVLIGHSLGSVLVTHTVLKLADGEPVTKRLRIVTLGSPLRLMSWFFPNCILPPEQLLDQFEARKLVNSWANMWRDADFIGRALCGPAARTGSARFAETSLGDGTHPDYWSDPRCWRAVLRYLDASAAGTVAMLASEWAEVISESEDAELKRRAKLAAQFALFVTPLAAISLYWIWYWISGHDWLAMLDFWSRWSVLVLTGTGTALFGVYYYFTSKRVSGNDVSRRQMLALYRLYWTVGMACTKPAALLSCIAGFVLWRSLP